MREKHTPVVVLVQRWPDLLHFTSKVYDGLGLQKNSRSVSKRRFWKRYKKRNFNQCLYATVSSLWHVHVRRSQVRFPTIIAACCTAFSVIQRMFTNYNLPWPKEYSFWREVYLRGVEEKEKSWAVAWKWTKLFLRLETDEKNHGQ